MAPAPMGMTGSDSQHRGLKIYFAGAIRAGRRDADLYARLILHLKHFGKVLTAHVGDASLLQAERFLTEGEIFERDMEWLHLADVVVAEVSTPSLGVGYEIAMAQVLAKRVICLYRAADESGLSAMIAGNSGLHLYPYGDEGEALQVLDTCLKPLWKAG